MRGQDCCFLVAPQTYEVRPVFLGLSMTVGRKKSNKIEYQTDMTCEPTRGASFSLQREMS